MNRKIILTHKSFLGGTSFDFLAENSIAEEAKEELQNAMGYIYYIDCRIAKNFLEVNKDYVYLGSEDLNHITGYNSHVIESIEKLKAMQWEEIDMG